ncbi:MAG TPA: phosphopyruvate hydratase [Pirellulales bacterium]
MTIRRLTGLEILDSRGCPTVRATCELAGGAIGIASVPSGASTGAAEAVELRDGDPARYRGKGCLKAVAHINRELNSVLAGRDGLATQADVDRLLIDTDGTPNKARLGANAILAVSVAFARASAAEKRLPLYQYFADLVGQPLARAPILTINLFSGGKHAGWQVPIQDVLIVPRSAQTIGEALVMSSAVYHEAVELIRRKYDMRWLTADEGGLAPPVTSAEQLLADAVECIRSAGFEPGKEVALAVDVASSHFYREGNYHLGTQPFTADEMISHLVGWVDQFPIISIEDGLAEEDWQHWPQLAAALAGKALVMGDDLLCTNPQRIRRAIDTRACNALLLKVNQIGTLTEALQAHQLARSADWSVTLSVRSGDTEDDWFADLAVGLSADYSKAGSLTQSERLAKYNRLLAIEAERTAGSFE